jgi:hypothetical protein
MASVNQCLLDLSVSCWSWFLLAAPPTRDSSSPPGAFLPELRFFGTVFFLEVAVVLLGEEALPAAGLCDL